MTKSYYSKFNKKHILSLVLNIIGFILFIFNYNFISIIILVISMFLNDGLFNKNKFVEEDNKIYFYESKNTSIIIFGIITLILLFIGFYMCINKNYYLFLMIYYIIVISISIHNYIISEYNKDNELDKYNKYLIKSIYKTNDGYYMELDNNDSYFYRFNNVYNYKELVNKLIRDE